ncbi:hypothetical protein [Geodermatophilus sp. SYSU D01119]
MSEETAVVVPARDAWPEYLRYRAYVCQPDRSFRPDTTHLGFYAEGAIQPLFPLIERWLPSVLFTRSEAARWRDDGDRRLSTLIERLLTAGPRTEGMSYGVMFLSAPEDPDTVHLPAPIQNDSESAEGRRIAWTQNQRYVPLSTLQNGATVTSQLSTLGGPGA